MSLSCDPAQETLSVCEHGQPVKFGICLLCNPTYFTYTSGDKYAELNNRINAIHEFKLNQIDENRKVSNKLDELIRDSKLYAHPLQAKVWQENIIDRLEKLENEIKELKRFQDITHLQYQKRNKEPHKCPVCDGKKGILNEELKEKLKLGEFIGYGRFQETDGIYDNCKVCNVTGIIWG